MKYLTVAEFTIQDVLPFAGFGCRPRDYRILNKKTFVETVYRVKMNSLRFEVFKKSLICSQCGLIGSKFLLQYDLGQDPDSGVQPHFNLYGINAEKELILMTKDHQVPKSKGGPDLLTNLRTMCFPCNFLKADSSDE